MATPENKAKIEYLERYKLLEKEVARLCDEYARWTERATVLSPTITDMPKGGGQSDPVQRAVIAMCDLGADIGKKMDTLSRVRCEIECALQSIEDGTLRLLMEYRYLNGMTWEEVAVKMNYNYRWVLRLHGRALAAMEINRP